MIRNRPTALLAALALGFAAPALGQTQTPAQPQTQIQTRGGPGDATSQQQGPHGSATGPLGPQLQAVQTSLSNAEQQIAQSRTGGQAPNWDQTLRALMGAEDTLTEMRTAGRDSRAVQDAMREVTAAKGLLERGNPEIGLVSNQLRTALNAITALNSGATGPATNPGPAVGGGTTR
jgi:hypothetical protein